MTEPIIISYKLNSKDGAKAYRSYAFHFKSAKDKKNFRYTMILIPLIAILLIYSALLDEGLLRVVFLILGILLLSFEVLVILIFLVIFPRFMAKNAEETTQAEGENTVVFDDEKILKKNKIVDARIEWSAFGRVYETPNYFLFVSNGNRGSYVVVPIRAFTTAQYINFRSLVQEKIQSIIKIQ